MARTSLSVAALAAAFVASASPSSAANFTGVWKINGTILTGTPVVFVVTGTCIFQQAGAMLSGTCQGPRALGTAGGTVNGLATSWQINLTPDAPGGASGELRFTGIRDADGVIHGQMMYSGLPGRVGNFAAHH